MEILPYLDPDTQPVAFVWYVLATTGDPPECRVGHSCCVVKKENAIDREETAHHNGCLYLVGGANPSGTLSDNPVLDLTTWVWDYKELNGFLPRYEQSLFLTKDNPGRIYIFGGADQTKNLNDIQYLDSHTNKWSKLKGEGDLPSARTYHTNATINDCFVIFGGGARGSTPVPDTLVHSFCVSTSTWSTLNIQGEPPKRRLGHATVTIGNKTYIHGGLSEGEFFDDLHVLDLDKQSWLQLEPVCGQRPSARAAHGAVSHGIYIYIFGGMSIDGALNDFYQLDTVSMTSTRVAADGPAPTPRLDFAMTIAEMTLPILPAADVTAPLSSEDSALHQQANQSGTELCAAASSDATTTAEQRCFPQKKHALCFIHGGMDTDGEIFHDTLVIRVS